MAFASGDSGKGDQPLTEINMVPLIDVMLVLLIIFIVAAPLLTHQMKIDLPQVSSAPAASEKQAVQIAIKDNGELFWNGEMLSSSELAQRLREQNAREPGQLEVHLLVARQTAYEKLAEVMGMAAREGITRIAFVTEPAPP